jgi:hypothetical protein
MRFRTIAVAVGTIVMMVGPAFVDRALSSVAGAQQGMHDHRNGCRRRP